VTERRPRDRGPGPKHPRAADRAGKPRPILGAPEVHLASTLVLEGVTGITSAQATWAPMPGAVGYQASLVDSQGATRQLTTQEPQLALAQLEPGTYTLTLRALDRYGLPGLASHAQQIRVVRPMLPLGAYIGSDGAIRLETYDRVGLAGAEGLWMTLGSASQYVPVPDSVGLFRGAAPEASYVASLSQSQSRQRGRLHET
jgi:hypothetical protein